MAHMTDDELLAVVQAHLQDARTSDADDVTEERAEAWRRYAGDLYGDERPDRSSVMSRDVMETVEAVMPSLVRTFLGSNEVVKFIPQQRGQEAWTEQASDYVRHIIEQDNDGFRLLHDWMKSALIHKVGIIKWYWDMETISVTETGEGLTLEQLSMLDETDDVEIVRHEQTQVQTETGEVVDLWNVEYVREKEEGRVFLETLAPEEHLINSRARSLHDRNLVFTCHRREATRSEAKESGYDPELIDSISVHDDSWTEEREAREDTSYYDDVSTTNPDPATEVIWIYESYILVDYERTGSGIAQWRKVCTGGGPTDGVLLHHESVKRHPFAALCPILLPHKFYGWSLADLTMDIQSVKTALWRMMMDGLYRTVFPRHEISRSGGVNMDQYLDQTPGGYVMVNQSCAIQPIVSNWDGAKAFPMMEYLDRVLEDRTGVTAIASGMDANVLQNQSATAVNEAAQAARSRIELIARVFGETGFTDLARGILDTVIENQTEPRDIFKDEQWATMDPSQWSGVSSVRVNVGLGTGNRDQQLGRYNAIAQKQEQILLQMGQDNPLVSIDEYYNTLSKMVEASDLTGTEQYFKDPALTPPTPPGQAPPDPKMAEMQAKSQLEQQKMTAQMQFEQQKIAAQMQADQQKAAASIDLEREKTLAAMQAQQQQMAAQLEVDREKALLGAQIDREHMEQKLILQREQMAQELALKREEMAIETQLEQMKMRSGAPDGQGNLPMSD